MRIIRQDFCTGIPQLIGLNPSHFYLFGGNPQDPPVRPSVFWMFTDTNCWYRFFLQEYRLHWKSYDKAETRRLMGDDFLAYEESPMRDIKEELILKQERILSIKMEQKKREDTRWGELKIRLEGRKEILIKAFEEGQSIELR